MKFKSDRRRIAAIAASHDRKINRFLRNEPQSRTRSFFSSLLVSEEDINKEANKKIAEAQRLTPSEIRAMEASIDGSFSSYLVKVLASINKDFALKLLTLYYTLRDENTPLPAKAAIIAVLVYFVTPIDLIPDLLAIVGFTDDFGFLLAAWSKILSAIKDDHIKAAQIHLRRIAGTES
jgi:uncharacterized membrane protein YkvA (DUF1232 family)